MFLFVHVDEYLDENVNLFLSKVDQSNDGGLNSSTEGAEATSNLGVGSDESNANLESHDTYEYYITQSDSSASNIDGGESSALEMSDFTASTVCIHILSWYIRR